MAAPAMAVGAGTVAVSCVCSAAVRAESHRLVPVSASTSVHSKHNRGVFSQRLARLEPLEAAHSVLNNRSFCNEKCQSQRASAARGEIPEEILEDSKFVPLNEDDPRYGPAVLLLLGFGNNEGVSVQKMLQEMEGDFLRVVLCTPEMIKGTLGEAVIAQQPDITTVRVAKDVPAVCFLSGLTGEEIMLLIQAFRDYGFEGTVFAAHVPNNTDKSLEELIEEIMGDHERLTKSREPTPA